MRFGLCIILTRRSATEAEYERSIAIFLHATAVEGLKELPDISIKWVQASELSITDDGIIRDREGTRVRCVWKSASWRHLVSAKQPAIVDELLFSPEVHVYQASRYHATLHSISLHSSCIFPPLFQRQPLWTALIDCPEFLSFVRSSVADGSLNASAGCPDGLQNELTRVFMKVTSLLPPSLRRIRLTYFTIISS
jgi:hypothetical protein